MKAPLFLLLLWPTYSHAECDFGVAAGDWVGLLIPHHRHDPPRHSLYITKNTLTLNGLEHKCHVQTETKFMVTLKNLSKREEYFKRCVELMYKPGALKLYIYAALNPTTNSTSELGDPNVECSEGSTKRSLGTTQKLTTDRATGIFVHRGIKAEDISSSCPPLEVQTTGLWTRPFAGDGHEFFTSSRHCTNTMESISSCRGRGKNYVLEWNVTMNCNNDKTQSGSDTHNQSSVKMVSQFACVGGFKINFGGRSYFASILMAMSESEDPQMVCLAHMFITPYKRLLMIPCELFMSYGFSYDRMNQNLFLIKERYSSVCSESSSHNNHTHGSTTVGSPGDYQSTKPRENLIMMDDLGDSTEFMIQQLAIEDLLQTTMTSSIESSRSRMTYGLLVSGMMGIMLSR